MKTIIAVVLLAMTFTTAVNAQMKDKMYMYRDGQKYESTPVWTFEGYNDIDVNVARHSKGAYLLLSKESSFGYYHIGGTVTVFLEDGTTIKCIDRGIRDRVDGVTMTLYNFTYSEVEKLIDHDIVRIRYSLIYSGGDLESFTANNPEHPNLYGMNKHFTSSYIGSLFLTNEELTKRLADLFSEDFASPAEESEQE